MFGKGENRPLLITIIAASFLMVGVFSAIGSIILLVEGTTVDIPNYGALPGGPALIFASILLAAGYGFLEGWSTIWYFGLIFTVFQMILIAVTLINGNFTLTSTLDAVADIFTGKFAPTDNFLMILYLFANLTGLTYLFKPNVRSFFLGNYMMTI